MIGKNMIMLGQMERIDAVQQMFHYHFKDAHKLDSALTMRSYFNEHPSIEGHNQPLATLGDAVIRLLILKELFGTVTKDSGVLTEEAKRYLNGVKLTEIAKDMRWNDVELKDCMTWGKGDDPDALWNDRMPGECLEAIFGAIFLDGGFNACIQVYNETMSRPSSETERSNQT